MQITFTVIRRAIVNDGTASGLPDEREACAKIADAYAREARGMTEEEAAAEAIAKLIRART